MQAAAWFAMKRRILVLKGLWGKMILYFSVLEGTKDRK